MLNSIRFERTSRQRNDFRQSLWIILVVATTACGPTRTDRPSENPGADGWEHFRLGEFELASRDFQQAAAAPATEAAGLFGLAQTWHLRQPNPDPAQAAALYQQVMARAPHSEYAAWSALALAWLQAVPPGQPLPEIALLSLLDGGGGAPDAAPATLMLLRPPVRASKIALDPRFSGGGGASSSPSSAAAAAAAQGCSSASSSSSSSSSAAATSSAARRELAV